MEKWVDKQEAFQGHVATIGLHCAMIVALTMGIVSDCLFQ
jgi:hypothetical protein